MIIDIHTHTFPDSMAERVLEKLSDTSNLRYYAKGSVDGLKESMEKNGIDLSVIMPVVTNPQHTENVNRSAIEINEKNEWGKKGVLSFGGLHPENSDYKKIIRHLADNGIKGVKFHPLFQEANFDDIRYMRMVDCCSENGLIVLVHAGYDASFPGRRNVAPEHILPVIKEVAPEKLILAHFGSFDCWDDVERMLVGENVYFDTAFSLQTVRTNDGQIKKYLSNEQFCRIAKAHGVEKILMGSDSPWADQGESVEVIRKSGLTEAEINMILGDNARALLGM